MDELIEMYRQTNKAGKYRIDKKLLKKYNFSETQWQRFMILVDDLELNEIGVRIMLDEIKAGKAVLK